MIQEKNQTDLCLVCQQKTNKLYSVAICPHSFCLNCCIAYISCQANNFDQARCLQEGCGAPLDKSLPTYTMLDSATLHRLAQFDSYKFLQQHHDYVACKAKDCSGMLKKKSRRCEVCQTLHCSKCLNVAHQGQCVQTEQEKEMKNLGFQKCPACSVWVQKITGCSIMSCKCGTDFCYRCGSLYSKDPCRKGVIWEREAQLRDKLKNLPSLCSKEPMDMVLFLPRLILILLVLLPFTVLYCVLLLSVLFSFFLLLVTIGAPIAIVCAEEEGNRCCRLVLVIVFFPLIMAFIAGFFILMMIFYPFCRNCNSHGLYDGVDQLLANVAICYISVVSQFLNCILCTPAP